MARIEAIVRPDLLVWARESAGYSAPEAGKRLHVRPAQIESWERGEKRPTFPQARAMAKLYRRPFNLFFLPEPPSDPDQPADFRANPEVLAEQSPELRWQLRRARLLRDAAVELAEANPAAFPPFPLRVQTKESPSAVARKIHGVFDPILENRGKWRTADDAFRGWRRAIEAVGALTFMARGIRASEMSGATLAFDVAPTILINAADHANRRVFSLLHELVHVALRKDGLSDSWDDDAADRFAVERFCNAVAAEALVPTSELTKHHLVVGRRPGARLPWTDGELEDLARHFLVSREAILRKLVDLQLVSKNQYGQWRAAHPYQPQKPDDDTEKEGGPSYYTLKIHELGTRYLRTVFDSFRADRINLADVCDYLGMRMDTALKLEGKLNTQVEAQTMIPEDAVVALRPPRATSWTSARPRTRRQPRRSSLCPFAALLDMSKAPHSRRMLCSQSSCGGCIERLICSLTTSGGVT